MVYEEVSKQTQTARNATLKTKLHSPPSACARVTMAASSRPLAVGASCEAAATCTSWLAACRFASAEVLLEEGREPTSSASLSSGCKAYNFMQERKDVGGDKKDTIGGLHQKRAWSTCAWRSCLQVSVRAMARK